METLLKTALILLIIERGLDKALAKVLEKHPNFKTGDKPAAPSGVTTTTTGVKTEAKVDKSEQSNALRAAFGIAPKK